VLTQIILLDQEELAPGGKALAQFKLEEPVVVLPRDRFVIRNYSPVFTIGGGKILDALPHKHKRLTQATITQLRAIQEGSDKENIALFVADSALAGLDLSQLIARMGKEPSRLSSLVHELIIENKLVLIDKESQKVIAGHVHQELIASILEQLESYHKKFPLNKGMLKEELKSKLPPLVDARLFNHLLNDLINASHITIEKENLWLTKHQPSLKDSQILLKDRIAQIYLKTNLTPPSFKELLEQLSSNEKETKSIINLLTGEGVMVKVKENLWFHREALETLKKDLMAYLNKNGEISTTGFKDLTQASRKYTIPLMEYCDQSKITIRVGDKRMLRDKKG
jgi:selenocysteine-specific elongation factor